MVAACQSEETVTPEKRQTIDIQGVNKDIKKTVGIDLLEFKSKIDKQFPSDSFYVEVCEDLLFNTGESKIYDQFGAFVTFDNGDSIAYTQRDSLFTTIFHCIGENFYLDDCKENDADTSFCKMKMRVSNSYKSVNGMYTLTTLNTIGDVYDSYRKGFLNYDELSYMVIVHHLLHDIYSMEKGSP